MSRFIGAFSSDEVANDFPSTLPPHDQVPMYLVLGSDPPELRIQQEEVWSSRTIDPAAVLAELSPLMAERRADGSFLWLTPEEALREVLQDARRWRKLLVPCRALFARVGLPDEGDDAMLAKMLWALTYLAPSLSTERISKILQALPPAISGERPPQDHPGRD